MYLDIHWKLINVYICICAANENGNLSLYLGRVKHVGGYVTVSNSPRLETLEFLENLTSIGGRNLWALG
jgi:hypothetical protein